MDTVNLVDDGRTPEPSPQCTARSKRSGQRCKRRQPGGGPCRFHGGAAPQVAAQREARMVVAAARTMYAEDYAERDPGDVLLAAVRDVDSIAQQLKRQVERREELSATDLLALGEWLDRAAKLAKTALDAGVAERQVRLDEARTLMVVDAMKSVLGDLGHDITTPAVQRVLAHRLAPLRGPA